MANPGKGGVGAKLANVAHQQIRLAEQPILHQIAQERAANLARAQAQMGFAKAAAALMQQAAPAVQAGYTNAANADAGYAKGLGGVVQNNLDANQQAHNSYLAQFGTPTGAMQQTAAPVGALSYGEHGYIPGTTLQREGAAWGAEAALAPGTVIGRGQQDAMATLANDPNLVKLQQQLAQLASTEPAVYQQLLDHFRSYMQGQQRIGLEQQSLSLRAQYEQASLAMAQERITLARNRDKWAIKNAIRKGHMPNSALSAKYGYIVDSHGNPILNGKGKKIPVKKASSSSGGLFGTGGPPSGKNPNGAGPFAWVGSVAGATESAAQKAVAASIVKMAHQYLGTPYVWGGESAKGFDCSGFAQYLYSKAGISIPRTTYDQWDAPNGHKVGKRQLMPGDLVFYKGSDSRVVNGRLLPGHVGVYIGHGQVIDAYGTGYGVRVDAVFSPALGGYMGARRYRRG
jgi:cell wall-associated NlpC family hydrolase